MRLSLQRHEQSDSNVVDSVSVDVEHDVNGNLTLDYRISADINRILIPEKQDTVRADNLWRSTCCEIFCQDAGQSAYHEINLSPSSRWAFYKFDQYRGAMQRPDVKIPPRISMERHDGGIILRAQLDPSLISSLDNDGDVHVGLSAIVEGISGDKTYWALRHPPGPPDFHNQDCFAHILRQE